MRWPPLVPVVLSGLLFACARPSEHSQSRPALGAMLTPRIDLGVALLGDGRVLACGGTADGTSPSAACEAYDPVTFAWSALAPMPTARRLPTVTMLATGDALVCGGGAARCDRLQVGAGTWAAAPSMGATRSGAAATLLPDGTVLMVGGDDAGTTELLDAGAWASAGSIAARSGVTATLLADGGVLVAGGMSGTTPSSAVDVYRPGVGWTGAAALPEPRAEHSATRLRSSGVLLVGGTSDGINGLATARVYDELAGTWGAPIPLAARRRHAAALLPSGRVLVAGGLGASGLLGTTEVYDPAAGTFAAGPTLQDARERAGAALLASGGLLLAGGAGSGGAPVGGTELVTTPTSPSWSPAGSLADSHLFHTATLLPSGGVLVASGEPGGNCRGVELYDPTANSWATRASTLVGHDKHSAHLLMSGKVLVMGEFAGCSCCGAAETYSPATNSWQTAGAANAVRGAHGPARLADGRVLVAGGYGGGGTAVATAEVYDPRTDTWSAVASMSASRTYPTATLLPSGKVLLAGSFDPYRASAEVYDPTANTWSPAGSMSQARGRHSAVLLPSGRVLVIGGETAGAGSSEVYDPVTNTWGSTATLAVAAGMNSSVLSLAGTVVVIGDGGTSQVYLPAANAWLLGPSTAQARRGATATRLLSGAVLAATGQGTVTAEVLDLGLGFQDTARPAVVSPPAAAMAGQVVTLTGTGLRGPTQAGGGGPGSAAADLPIVSVIPLEGGLMRWIRPTAFSDTSVTLTIPADHPYAHSALTVYTAGIPSLSVILAVTRGADGDRCEGGAECQSGSCVEGVCCASAACPVCQSCAVGGTGVCTDLPQYSEDHVPPGACDGVLACDGAGACRSKNGALCTDGVDCASGSCVAGVCDGLTHRGIGQTCPGGSGTCESGNCVDGYCCEAACARCYGCGQPGHLGVCTALPPGTDYISPNPLVVPSCTDFYTCDGSGGCKPKNGVACTQSGQCVSNLCVDGYCCDQACTGTCQSCNVAGVLGSCVFVPRGLPDSTGPAPCVGASACDGLGHCKAAAGQACPGGGEDCATGICVDGVCCSEPCGVCRTCATGSCQLVARGVEDPGACEAPLACDGLGACRLARGAPCSQAVDCVDLFCADGVCCNELCTALCFGCATPGHVGTCGPLPAQTEDSSQYGDCLVADGLMCNGVGGCGKANGAACSSPAECGSLYCVDGFCCNEPCMGNCEVCDDPQHRGECSQVAAGTDPRTRCQASVGGDPTCAGACDSTGQCAFPDVGTKCGTCSACDGTGRCQSTPVDDDACGAIDCSGLDTTCRSYQDLTGNRCASLATCKTANDPATCTEWTDLNCSDGGGPAQDGGATHQDGGGMQPPQDGGTTGDKSGGCSAARSNLGAGAGWPLYVLPIMLAVWRRPRRT